MCFKSRPVGDLTVLALAETRGTPSEVQLLSPLRPSLVVEPGAPQIGVVIQAGLLLICLLTTRMALAERDDFGLNLALHDRAVLLIISECPDYESSGTGFLVNANGTVVTNAHVVQCEGPGNHSTTNSISIAVDDPELGMDLRTDIKPEDMRSAAIIAVDDEMDLAIIQVSGLQADRVPLKFAMPHAEYPPKGLRIFSAGYPGGSRVLAQSQVVREPTRKDGAVSLVNELPNRTRVFETDADISQGMSGGPVSDLCGNVVGVNVRGLAIPGTGVGGLGFAQAIRGIEAMDFLKAHGHTYDTDLRLCRAAAPAISTSLMVTLFLGATLLGIPVWMLWQRTSALAAAKPGVGVSRVLRDEISRYLRQNAVIHSLLPARRVIIGQGSVGRIQARLRERIPVVIGRGPTANLIVGRSELSREHVRITLEQGHVWLEDLHSTHGTFVYRKSVADTTEGNHGEHRLRLRPSERVALGTDDLDNRFYLGCEDITFEVK